MLESPIYPLNLGMKLILNITRYLKKKPIDSLINFWSAQTWPDAPDLGPNDEVTLSPG